MAFKKGVKPKGSKQWKPGQSGNPKGRPRKFVLTLTKEYGYSKSQVEDVYRTLVGLTRAELKKIADKRNSEIIEVVVARYLLKAAIDKKEGLRILETVITRPFGAPKQSSDITSKGKSITEIDYSKLSERTLRELAKQSTKEGDGGGGEG